MLSVIKLAMDSGGRRELISLRYHLPKGSAVKHLSGRSAPAVEEPRS